MSARTVARRFVKPVVGQDAWQFLYDVNKSVTTARRKRAERVAAAPNTKRSTSGELTDAQIVARAKAITAEREKRAWSEKSKNLTELAKYYKTDKWGGHNYTPRYQTHFEHLRDKPINLLEIGIGGYKRDGAGGASLRMWKAFFPKAQIVGIDIEDKSFVDEDRIRSYQGDQTDPELLHRVNDECGPFDIIIDDGSHRSAHIIATFAILFPLLAENGIYVVEDTQTSYWPERGGSDDRYDPNTSMAMLKNLCDGLNFMEFVDESYEPTYSDRNITGVFFYHNLVFIQKGPNTETTRRRAILKTRYAAPAES